VNSILLVDDHASYREMLTLVFDAEPDFEVVAQAGSLAEARGMLEGVDLAVIDLDLPDGDGTDLIGELRVANPHGLVLVLTASAERRVHARAVEAGAAGALHKSVHVEDIIETAKRLVRGETILSMDEIIELLRLAGREREREYREHQATERLTRREKEVLQTLAGGLSDSEIAEHLNITIGTVRNHFVSIFSKLGVHSRLQALVFALRKGIVELS
jgi:DNA-binding NarL/FixJ family response regulator